MFRHTERLVLTATDLTNHLACEHLAEQKRAIALEERARPRKAEAAHADLTRQKGDEHEHATLARLSKELGGHVEIAEVKPWDEVAVAGACAATLDALRAGAPLVFQAVLCSGRWYGKADFLRKVPRKTAFGDWGYEVVDTKLARHVKPAVVHQLSLYSRLLGELQGVEAPLAHLILGDGTEESVELRRYAALHRYACAALERSVDAGARTTYPEPTSHCGWCDFGGECDARWRADDHLSLVANLRRDQRAKLTDVDIDTLARLAAEAEGSDPAGFGEERFDLARGQAALQLEARESGLPTRRHLEPARARGYARLPLPDAGDLFFDLEGDPYVGNDGGIEFLWGWTDASGVYDCVWGHDADGERAAFEHFVDLVQARRLEHPGLRVFHYAPHERSKLASLALKYASREEDVDDLLRNGILVDLYAVVRQALQVGEESYSLKRLERHYGFVRHEKTVRQGGGAILTYEAWLETQDPAKLEAIRAYNEEDCVSTLRLRDWLRSDLRPAAAAHFEVDFDELAEPEPEEERQGPEWLPGALARVETLRAGLGADPTLDTSDEAERRLLSHLLLYHHRESKPEYWDFFRLKAMTPAELVDEREAIGELERDWSVEPEVVKQSLAYPFTFPPQEFKVGDEELLDPTTGVKHKVHRLDPDRVWLRRSKKADPPQVAALMGTGPVWTKKLRERLEVVADDLPAHPAVRALLRRETPRLGSGTSLPTAELSPEAMAALVVDLQHGALVVQGPPGTGKTYRAARMVVAAMRAGQQVAITANSHAAIHNLLRAVEEHAKAIGYVFRGIVKGEHYVSPQGLIEATDDNKDCLAEHNLVAGTSWLIAAQERERFDVLFVDEAGQFALANAVACAAAAKRLVLLGDPQQLPQVTKAEHPDGSGGSVLDHLLAGSPTVAAGAGLFLPESWRMHPGVCAFVSERSYEGRLVTRPACAGRRVEASGAVSGAGLRFVGVPHEGRSQSAPEEAEAIAALCRELLLDGTVTDDEGRTRDLLPKDLMVVAPYNLAVRCINASVPEGVEVGTVDRFQGQEAPVVFYALTCSTGEDVPRGLDFLFDEHRMNVAVSRAQCLSVVVASPRLLDADCRTLGAMQKLDGLCRYAELATTVPTPLPELA